MIIEPAADKLVLLKLLSQYDISVVTDLGRFLTIANSYIRMLGKAHNTKISLSHGIASLEEYIIPWDKMNTNIDIEEFLMTFLIKEQDYKKY